MGLDNGFRLKNVKRHWIPEFVELPFSAKETWDEQDVELVYWRKCWGLRAAVLRVLHAKPDAYESEVEAEDIPAIIRAITPFMSKEYWEDEGESIWTFEEKFPHLVQDLVNLKWLEGYLKEHPESKCYFYDSY